jgi:hypothetical protein
MSNRASPALRRAYGRTILPMTTGSAGSNDLVRHTLKHFLARQEAWGSLPPRDATPPDTFVAEAKRRGLGTGSFGSGVQDARWWAEPGRAFVLAAHDDGFYPRYAKLAGDAGRPGAAGSKWTWVSGARHAAEIDGMVVVVELRSEDELIVVSAYRSLVSRESTSPGRGLATFGEVWAARCRKRPPAASGSARGAIEPFPGDVP